LLLTLKEEAALKILARRDDFVAVYRIS